MVADVLNHDRLSRSATRRRSSSIASDCFIVSSFRFGAPRPTPAQV